MLKLVLVLVLVPALAVMMLGLVTVPMLVVRLLVLLTHSRSEGRRVGALHPTEAHHVHTKYVLWRIARCAVVQRPVLCAPRVPVLPREERLSPAG